ncbi:DUF1566 domain-containing protein [Candidatus Bipolaricaulota bacterium]
MRTRKIALIFAFFAIFAVGLFAGRQLWKMGNLAPPGTPETTSSYTLEDVYRRLNEGTAGSESTFTGPPTGPEAETMFSIDEIMGIAPHADNTYGAMPDQVLAGRKYWSLRTDGSGDSDWGEETGSLYGGCTCSGYVTLGRWCDNGDGTITDMSNCLVWLKKADWGGAKPWEDCASHDDAHTRAGLLEAGSAGADLSDGSEVGDWRLPTKEEAYALTHGSWPQGLSDPIRVTGLPETGSIFFWTSSTDSETETEKAYFVELTDDGATNGKMWSIGKEFDQSPGIYVWPVRSY